MLFRSIAESIENESDGVKFFVLGYIYELQGNNDNAERYYLQAIDNRNIKAMNNLAYLYKNQERYENAEKLYLQAIDNGHVNAMHNLAYLYDDQERYEEAEKFYLQAIDNGNINAMNNLANLYLQQNIKKSEALTYITLYSKQHHDSDDLLIIIEIWNGIFNNLTARTIELLKNEDLNLYFHIINLLIHQQKTLVLEMFNNPDFRKETQDKYKVPYYACLLLNNKTENELILKIPDRKSVV